VSAGRIAAAVVALGLVALAARRRRHVVALLLAAAALGIYAAGLLDLLPDPERVIEEVATTLGQWTYLLVGALAFLETGAFVGLVAPGETTVILGGVIAGQGEISLLVLLGIVWGAAILGDSTSFLIGRRLGRGFLLRHGPRVKITEERLEQVEGYFARHGGKTILIGRFIGIVRALAPFIAGTSRMPYARFIPYSVLGTGLWAATFSVLGYVFWRSFSEVADVAGRATFAFGVVVGTAVGIVLAYRQLRRPEVRARVAAWMEAKPVLGPLTRRVLRPAWRVALPQLRFLRDRLTPGNLGIEFTTSIAVVVAGLYVFVLEAVLVSDETPLTPGDQLAQDVAAELRGDAGIDIAEVVTFGGSGAFTGGLVLVAMVLLAWRRKWLELVTLFIGYALVRAAVVIAKEAIERPRPEGALVPFDGFSYPSGHAASATVLVALAIVAARVLPNLVSRAALIGAAVAVVALVGLSRIYLRVHWWSDVVGGWGLGFAIFAACGAVALVVAHLRQNGRVRPAPRDHG
jgi:undecaprenyl-diphosphatase